MPEILEDKMIDQFFRYESGTKTFKEQIGIKGFTLSSDAVTLNKVFLGPVKKKELY